MFPPRFRIVLRALLLLSLACAVAGAQEDQRSNLRFDGGTAKLGGAWQFHLGDSPTWADPAFDDSTWDDLSADRSWGVQGHLGQDGFAWYRRHIDIAPGTQTPANLALLIPYVDDVYAVYWNGRLVGSLGTFPPHAVWIADLQKRRIFPLGPAQSGVIAVRVWKAPFSSIDTGRAGGFRSAPILGSPEAVAAIQGRDDYRWLRGAQFYFGLALLNALVMVLGLLSWLRDRTQWVHFWTACFAAPRPVSLLLYSAGLPVMAAVGIYQLIYALGDVSLWFLLLWLLDLRGLPRAVWMTRILAACQFAISFVFTIGDLGFGRTNIGLWRALGYALLPAGLILEFFPFYLIALAVLRRRKLDPVRWTIALLAFLTQMILVISLSSAQGNRWTHWTLGRQITQPLFVIAGNAVNARDLSGALLLAALVYALYRRSAENRRLQMKLEEEIRNARAVQQVLIPEAIPSAPGFKVESVYKPAGDVGGDFFQILPVPAGGVLVIIGDVSGKGMPAAMTVSLLVGTVRTLAQYTQSPAKILNGMNQQMLARSQGGFTTCLILRADPDGTLTVANAGHIAPYLNCQELAVENGLPLGLSADATYSETSVRLAEDTQLTLLTDGVVEARSKSGELFGFDRTSAIATQPADDIAQAAQAFGQEDDITVLTLSRISASQSEPSLAETATVSA